MDNEKITQKKMPFIQVPKALFVNERYSHLSIAAIMLYALLLDRYRLTVRKTITKKCDKEIVHISYSIAEVSAMLRCGHDKAGVLFRELQTLGLIDRKRCGLGQYSQIVVFLPIDNCEESETIKAEFQNSQISDYRICRSEEVDGNIYKEIDINYFNKSESIKNSVSIEKVCTESNASPENPCDFEMLFENLYEYYPANRKSSRAEDYEIYRKTITTYSDAQMALENLSKWCSSTNWKNEGGKYIPLFKNYLLRAYWRQQPSGFPNTLWGSETQSEAERETIRRLVEG